MKDSIQRHGVRWWTYQRERFPLLAHGPLVAVFSLSALGYSVLLQGQPSALATGTALAAFGSALLLFLQLRIADEFKDLEDDRRFRPYRAVPRGLVTLRELGMLAAGAAGVQLALALLCSARLLPLLGLIWGYALLMRVEFFAPERLRRHPLLYLVSHMLIVPFLAFYVMAFDWAVQGTVPSLEVGWFLLASFFNGIILEIGRKLRAPEQEEPGVETYSRLWGHRRAVRAWLAALVLTTLASGLAAYQVDYAWPMLAGLGVMLGVAVVVSGRFLRRPVRARARLFEALSGVWTLLLYLGLGLLPLL